MAAASAVQQPQADQSRVADSLIVRLNNSRSYSPPAPPSPPTAGGELLNDRLFYFIFNSPIHALPFENCSFCRVQTSVWMFATKKRDSLVEFNGNEVGWPQPQRIHSIGQQRQGRLMVQIGRHVRDDRREVGGKKTSCHLRAISASVSHLLLMLPSYSCHLLPHRIHQQACCHWSLSALAIFCCQITH